jgi:peptide/nickel transport system substrate-binding protein
MDEPALRDLVAKVKVGTLSRRAFVQKMVALGLTAPMAGQVLRHCGVAKAEATFLYKPTNRGGGGTLKLLWWQAPTLLNPHLPSAQRIKRGRAFSMNPSPLGTLTAI